MDPAATCLIPLEDDAAANPRLVGGKGANLHRLLRLGYRVPPGVCLPVSAYLEFIRENKLDQLIAVEIERKPMDQMRWEEMWDAALRLRTAFLRAPLPQQLEQSLQGLLSRWGKELPLSRPLISPR